MFGSEIYLTTETKKIVDFTHHELGLSKKRIEPEGIPDLFVVFQVYYAVLYIPFFPEDKIYAFQKDGHTYRAPEDIKNHIELYYPIKTPWYFYIGFIIFIILALSALLYLLLIFK